MLVPSFPVTVSEGGRKEIPPGPPLEGHLVTHESGILGALPGMFQAWIVKRIHDVISWALVRNTGIRRLDKMLEEALESEKLPAEKDRAFWLVQGNAQYRVFPREMAEDMEVVLVPREEWPSHGFFGVLVVWSRSQGDGEGTRRVPNSSAGVACDVTQEGGFTSVRLLGLRFVGRDTFCVLGRRWQRANRRPLCGMLVGQ